jgi:hypothetical protein
MWPAMERGSRNLGERAESQTSVETSARCFELQFHAQKPDDSLSAMILTDLQNAPLLAAPDRHG